MGRSAGAGRACKSLCGGNNGHYLPLRLPVPHAVAAECAGVRIAGVGSGPRVPTLFAVQTLIGQRQGALDRDGPTPAPSVPRHPHPPPVPVRTAPPGPRRRPRAGRGGGGGGVYMGGGVREEWKSGGGGVFSRTQL